MSPPPVTPLDPEALPLVRHWVGVDGGGTATRARLCDAQGRTLAEGHAGPSALGQGAEQAWRHIEQAVRHAVDSAGALDFEWSHCALGLGLSGAGLTAVVAELRALLPPCARIAIDSDVWTGLLGAHAGGAGALLIAGTGSVAMAHWPDGRRSRVGGWGWRLGDEGSGAWLGQAAVRHLQHGLDGREPRGPLAEALLARVGGSAGTLLDWQRHATQRDFAAFAPLVFELEGDDPAACALLQRATQDLVQHLQALDPEHRLPLALGGSVARRLAPRLQASWSGRWIEPQGDAMDGALRLVQDPKVTA